MLGSDVDAIVKASRDQVLVFAQDMVTGKGRAGARVLVAGTAIFREGGSVAEAVRRLRASYANVISTERRD